MSSISAGTSAGTALVQSGDTTGALVIKTGGSAATAATFNADQTVTLAAPLPVASGGTGATSLSGITVGTATNATNATTATNLAGGSNGTIPYQSAAGTTQMLAVGTTGQVLTSAGASAPTWSAPSTGAMVFITSVTASSSATVDLEDAMTDYDDYVVLIDNVIPTSNAVQLQGRLKIGGSYLATASYQTTWAVLDTAGTSITTSSYDAAGIIQYTVGNAANTSAQNINGAIWFTRPSSTTQYQALRHEFYVNTNAFSYYSKYIFGFANNSTVGALTGLRFYFNSGNISTGNFRLYGIKKS